MTLTRRRLDTEHLESYGIFDAAVRVGRFAKVNGIGGQMIWQWSCGFYPGCDKRTQQTSGSQDTYDDAKTAFQEAWQKLRPQVTSAMRGEWLEDQAFTAWKYAMWDAKCRMPTQNTDGRSYCFCGAKITSKSSPDHVRSSHMNVEVLREHP